MEIADLITRSVTYSLPGTPDSSWHSVPFNLGYISFCFVKTLLTHQLRLSNLTLQFRENEESSDSGKSFGSPSSDLLARRELSPEESMVSDKITRRRRRGSNHSSGSDQSRQSQSARPIRRESRRQSHISSEQRRRTEMNAALNDLKDLLKVDGTKIQIVRAAYLRLQEYEAIMKTCPHCRVYMNNPYTLDRNYPSETKSSSSAYHSLPSSPYFSSTSVNSRPSIQSVRPYSNPTHTYSAMSYPQSNPPSQAALPRPRPKPSTSPTVSRELSTSNKEATQFLNFTADKSWVFKSRRKTGRSDGTKGGGNGGGDSTKS
ncbi:hypothetical protein BKA69DRAFT_1059634 [Paraphysoderma sedebokerense]|nr:hypothetical protein BKA69DRAFT_1059634 [Paraphysoderma sedebokerense]